MVTSILNIMSGHSSRPTGVSDHRGNSSDNRRRSAADTVDTDRVRGATSNSSLPSVGDRATPSSPRHGDLPPLLAPRSHAALDSLNSPASSSSSPAVYSTPLDVPSINCATASTGTTGVLLFE